MENSAEACYILRPYDEEKEFLMEHAIYRVTQFTILGLYQLKVMFDDGTDQTIDFQPVLTGELFGPLRDERLFRQVEVDPEVHTLVWPNGADFDPATLHDWPRYLPVLLDMAQQWAAVRAG